ncbi:ribonuclease HII [Marivirga lumbricoides]|uniref:Ribonuclease HII n=1 Tax=Marivirga lumbricoides TaxID=1046115 RepID=A0ABQ1L7X2_9BACT|nr:ribonuclease HII [Marivirga lumbricoides]
MSLLSYYHNKNTYEAGCDEVGRGCLAGPVVAAAVILPKDFTHSFLTDSKLLNATKRKELVKEIKQQAVAYAIASCSPAEIDKINILHASFLAMHRALDQLKPIPDFLLIDGNRFTQYKEIDHACIVKGDSKYLSIAAASILAKEYRDELMHQLAKDFPYYGWDTNVGYPTKVHRKGLEEFGPCHHHRKSFKLTIENLGSVNTQ